ncbi:MAG TPA: hypothetical protein VKH37_04035 [Ferruginibacter sp.]|nr:hypothetical protein [Ferruginibacter sp.]
MEILVFKTNLNSSECISRVQPLLNVHPHIIKWNVDLHDCDNVLRVVTKSLTAGEVEQLLAEEGYYCEELQ